MTTLYAQPYNIDATGFYFDSAEDYESKAKGRRGSHRMRGPAGTAGPRLLSHYRLMPKKVE